MSSQPRFLTFAPSSSRTSKNSHITVGELNRLVALIGPALDQPVRELRRGGAQLLIPTHGVWTWTMTASCAMHTLLHGMEERLRPLTDANDDHALVQP